MTAVKNKSAILANYRQLREKVQMSEALVLDLLAHPDAKVEDILTLREKVIETRKTLEQVWQSVDKLFIGQIVTPQPPHHIEMRRKIRQHKRDAEAEASATTPSQSTSTGSPSM